MMTSPGVIQPQDAKYIKRRVKSGSIDVHPTETALIVNYEVEAIILGELENPVLSDKKNCQKIIRLKSLNKNSDCAALAKEVVNKCSLIHPSKVADVEHLIYFLQSRKENVFADGGVNVASNGSGLDSSTGGSSSGGSTEKASFANLEQYVSLLYEELADRVRGSAMIAQLSRENDNLEELTRNEGVLSALARVLREDYKRSLDLSFNILSVFHSFSCFSQFHPLILQYKMGSLCLVIAEFELDRYRGWKTELLMNRGREAGAGTGGGGGAGVAAAGGGGGGGSISRLPVPKSAVSRPASSATPADRRRSATPTSLSGRLSLIPAPKTAISQRSPSTPDEESAQKKFATMVWKQDKLLKVNFSLLLNIAENIKVEDKIRKRNMVAMLVEVLQRNSVPLLIVATKFLTKLSIRLENKDEMAKLNVVESLPKLLQMNNFELEEAALGLLFNLSFDTNLREVMVRVGFLQKLTSLLSDERHVKSILKILYHLSMDDRVKAMFTFTDSLPKLMKMLISTEPKSEVYLVLIALAVNVALSPRCAEVMCDSEEARQLEQRALAYRDSLIMKVLRNLARHPTTHRHFLEFAEEMLSTLTSCPPDDDFLLETTGTLANLPLSQLADLSQLVERHQLLSWLLHSISSDESDDDQSLEVVMLVGALAAEEKTAWLLCQAGIILALIDLLKRKQEDDEMVLQIIYVFYQVSRHNDSRDYLVHKTQAVDYLIDLMNDPNTEIRKVCGTCIDIIKEEETEYEERVKTEKFTAHNGHWLAMVENAAVLDSSLLSLPPPTADDVVSPGLAESAYEAIPRYDLSQSLSGLHAAGSHISLSTMDDIEIVSNHPMSDEGSRPLSRYDSEGEELSDSLIQSLGGGRQQQHRTAVQKNEEAVENALRNLVISDSSGPGQHFYHIGTTAPPV